MSETQSDCRATPPRGWVGSLLGIVVFGYLTGVLVAEFETFPYDPFLRRPLRALEVVFARSDGLWRDPDTRLARSPYWLPSSGGDTGVLRRKEGRAPGLTLYGSLPESSARLVDSEGNVLHTWSLKFREAWPNPGHIRWPVSEHRTGWAAVELLPDGDLLAIYHANGDTPYGYGLVRVDRDSSLVWKYPGHAHHDLEILPNGEILVLTVDVEEPIPEVRDRVESGMMLSDDVVRLSADGEELERISLTRAFQRSGRASLLRRWHDADEPWDVLHTNNVERVGADFAEHHEFAEPNHVLLSFRSLNAVGLLDPTSERMDWLRRGPWLQQHDPDPLPNGHLMVFDNRGGGGAGGYSRILEFDPESGEVVWSYSGSESAPFSTDWSGEQVLLSNGNVLISSPAQSRIFEVSRQGEIVWDFRNPSQRVVDGRTYTALTPVHHVRRLPRSQLDFVDRPTAD